MREEWILLLRSEEHEGVFGQEDDGPKPADADPEIEKLTEGPLFASL